MTAQQAAAKWNTSVRNVQDLCKRGRIPGAEHWGNTWMIPAEAQRPPDGRSKAARSAKEKSPASQPLLRKSPFLDMTDLYQIPGTADRVMESLAAYPEAQQLFSAEIAYSRCEIDKVYLQANYFLESHTGFYAVIAGGMLLSLCAMWKGDAQMWYKAKKHILEAPCKDDMDREIVALALASADSAIRNTDEFPNWFMQGRFYNLPRDAHPAARVYYAKHLLISAQDLASGKLDLIGVSGFGLLRIMPYLVEPMISQMMAEQVIVAEIYLRILVAIAYHQYGDDTNAAAHLDKAITLCLADRLYGPLVEFRRQLGLFLDYRLAQIDPDALKKVKELHKQLHAGWTSLHNTVLNKSVHLALSSREREVARLASFGLSDRQIAHQLHLSESSVKAAVKSAKNKTGVNIRKDLAVFI